MWALGGASTSALAQDAPPPVLLVLDQSAVDYGDAPHLIPASAANAAIATVGLRETPAFFTARVGESVTLPGGADGSDGWFAIRNAPLSWSGEDGTDDGLENFFAAGAGLGSPDEAGERTSLLASVPGVVGVRGSGLYLLAGRRVCAVLYDGDVTASTDPEVGTSLAGANLGAAAFEVTSVGVSADEWPAVTVQILDVHETCGGAIGAFSEAP
jgi:hypothetical protein